SPPRITKSTRAVPAPAGPGGGTGGRGGVAAARGGVTRGSGGVTAGPGGVTSGSGGVTSGPGEVTGGPGGAGLPATGPQPTSAAALSASLSARCAGSGS